VNSAAAGVPEFADVKKAAARLRGLVIETPVLESPELNARLGGRLLIKAECLQRTGSFKFRGAYNRIAAMADEDRQKGVVAFSSGNHAQGVALAAKLLGSPAVIVMPTDAPAIKLGNTESLGAEIVLYDRLKQSREAIAAQISKDRGATLIPPFDDAFVIAGQGTCGMEIARQTATMGVDPDAIVVPASGGGLVAGIALALSESMRRTAIYSAEPAGHDDLARSLRTGKRMANAPGIRSICDALLAPTPGEITFPINLSLLAGGVAVTDDETKAAMRTAFTDLKIVLEPGGAVALAAALTGHVSVRGRVIVVVCSGGNVDPDIFCEAIRSPRMSEAAP
jgi:threonine dehydratase